MLVVHLQRQFAAGMQWSIHDSPALAKAHAKQTPAAHLVRTPLRLERSDAVQLALGLYEGPIQGEACSAALAVGLVMPNVTVCQTLDDGSVWLCAISNGVPLPDQDRVLAPQEAGPALRELIGLHSEIVGDVPGARCSLEEVLAELQSQLADRRILKRQLSAIRLQRQSLSVLALGKLVLLLSLPVLAVFGWQSWQKLQKMQREHQLTLTALAQSRQEAEQAAALRQERIAAFARQVESRRKELATATGSVPALWLQWNQIRRALPFSVGGFVADSLQCDPGKCRAAWSARGPWVRYGDKRQIPGWIADADASLSASSEYQVPPAPAAGMTAQRYASAEALRLEIAQAMQFLAPGIQLEAVQPVTITPPPDLGLSPQTIGAAGKLHLAFQGPAALVRAHDAMAVLARWPVQINAVNWSQLPSPQGAIAIDGGYVYVQH